MRWLRTSDPDSLRLDLMADDDGNALRGRIEQLEATIVALQAGQLDAIVGGAESGTVFTLENEERPFRLMVERMAEGALTLDAEDGRILYCNMAFASMVRVRLETVVGRRFDQFFPERERDEAERIVKASGGVRVNTKLIRGDGVVSVAISSVSIESGEGNTLCVIVSDRSQRRIAERLRRQQTELETESQRKDEFIAMLGHELRNPLAPVQHAAELLVQGDVDPQRAAVLHATILRQTLQLRRLVDDLLDTARISRGTLKIAPSLFDARQLVDSALEVSKVLFASDKRDLHVEIPDVPVFLRGDIVRLTQVLTNLINNAAKFTDEGDHVWVRLRAEEGYVVLEVSDSGRGIDQEMLSTIFTAFVQEDIVFDSAVGGLGLGLALVQRIVELHGGTVRATSAGRGLGAQFRVELPQADDEHDAAPAPHVPDSEAPTQRRILVCDDNTDAAEMMAMLLEAAGHEVVTTYTGEDAIAQAISVQPDLVFLDIGLPGMDGYEVARQLRSRPQTHDVTIAALTGYGQIEDREAALTAGCDLHLVKPVDRAAIDEALRFQRDDR